MRTSALAFSLAAHGQVVDLISIGPPDAVWARKSAGGGGGVFDLTIDVND